MSAAVEERPAHGAWAALSLALIAQIAVSISEQGVVTLTGFIHDDLGLTNAQAGLLVAALPAGRALASYSSGRAVDRMGERVILIGGSIATGLAGLLASVTPAAGLGLALLIIGAFSATPTPAGGKLILLAFPRRRRGLAMGIRQTGIPIGGFIAALLLPWVAASHGWRAGLAVMGALSVVIALLAAVPRQPEIGSLEPGEDAAPTAPPKLLRDRQLVLLVSWALLMVGGQYVLVAFLPIYLHEGAGVTLAIATLLVAAVQFGGIGGRIGWGLMSDRLFNGRRRPLVLFISVSACLSFAMLAALPQGDADRRLRGRHVHRRHGDARLAGHLRRQHQRDRRPRARREGDRLRARVGVDGHRRGPAAVRPAGRSRGRPARRLDRVRDSLRACARAGLPVARAGERSEPRGRVIVGIRLDIAEPFALVSGPGNHLANARSEF